MALTGYRVANGTDPDELERKVLALALAGYLPYGNARYDREARFWVQTMVIGDVAGGGGDAPAGGQVDTVVAGTAVTVNSADPVNPIVNVTLGTTAGTALAGNGNAATATSAATLTTGRTIAISGDITGTATSFNGSANISIPAAITAGAIVNADVNAAAAIASSKIDYTGIAGYSAGATQRLTHVSGVLTWVTDV